MRRCAPAGTMKTRSSRPEMDFVTKWTLQQEQGLPLQQGPGPCDLPVAVSPSFQDNWTSSAIGIDVFPIKRSSLDIWVD